MNKSKTNNLSSKTSVVGIDLGSFYTKIAAV
jgi:hypothetical protein